jgi:hypothetical protein
MRVRKIPSGYFELVEGVLIIEGNEPLQIRLQDIESANCREGKKILLPSTPYGVFECAFRLDGEIQQRRMFFRVAEIENMRAMCRSIQQSLAASDAA